ncbi:hypothetical protein SAY87_021103 [Trapa incisa]|uniref:Pectinesterase n=1 Tax=Trapa incisa TaxID=236973 RepID=A0AAN7JSL2_9MYRT|nr:hypothetical protein SAY87_021103 [Trapa incisa]
MGSHKFMILLFVPSFMITLSAVFGYNLGVTRPWCAQTPHPETCQFYLGHDPRSIPIRGRSQFRNMLLQLALSNAKNGWTNTYSLGSRYQSGKGKAAWADCVKLYEYTVDRLNSTANPNVRSGADDSQTWLSTALTNIETCKAGFVEMGVSDNTLPLLSNNVSALISNTLALNDPSSYSPPRTTNGFPTWVRSGDRKLLQSSSPASNANVVVAQDGSGDYMTINESLAAVPKRPGNSRYIIYIKAGTYDEHVEIGSKLKNIMFVGDGIGQTIITGNRSNGGGYTTYNSATVAAVGDGFIARDITFQNTAGAVNHQAVALRSGSDLSVFYRCSFEGYQDTLYAHSDRQFYRECDIYGTVDFIFGNAAVVFQNCNIYARYPPNKVNTVTAQGRTDPNQNTGISIHDCNITAAPDLAPVQDSVKTYLGRPWKLYSRTVVMETYLDSLINAAGWLEWSGTFALDTLYYGEYMNTGPGSATDNRVTWAGYHVMNSSADASNFTVGSFIAGDSWLPATGVPYTSGL